MTERVIRNLREKGVGDKVVLVGGAIPETDVAKLKDMGVAEVFVPGASIRKMVDFVRTLFLRNGHNGETSEVGG